jgi:hypothetical protein
MEGLHESVADEPSEDGSIAASAKVDRQENLKEKKIAIITAGELGKVQESLERIDKGIGELTTSLSGLVTEKRSHDDRDRRSEKSPARSEEDRGDEVVGDPDGPLTFTPEVRYCNSHQFKNRYGEEEGAYAMEALVGGAYAIESLNTQYHRTAEGLDANSAQLGKDAWIHRVRINSPAIMRVLGSVNGDHDPWEGRPHCFSRPFRYFIRMQSKMEEEVKKMEEKVAQAALLSETTSDAAVEGDVGENEVSFYRRNIFHFECLS